MEMSTNAMAVITLQYIIVLNQHVCFKLYNGICQLYFNKPGKKLKYCALLIILKHFIMKMLIGLLY